jgi:hypothetical protein
MQRLYVPGRRYEVASPEGGMQRCVPDSACAADMLVDSVLFYSLRLLRPLRLCEFVTPQCVFSGVFPFFSLIVLFLLCVPVDVTTYSVRLRYIKTSQLVISSRKNYTARFSEFGSFQARSRPVVHT